MFPPMVSKTVEGTRFPQWFQVITNAVVVVVTMVGTIAGWWTLHAVDKRSHVPSTVFRGRGRSPLQQRRGNSGSCNTSNSGNENTCSSDSRGSAAGAVAADQQLRQQQQQQEQQEQQHDFPQQQSQQQQQRRRQQQQQQQLQRHLRCCMGIPRSCIGIHVSGCKNIKGR